MSLLYFLFKLFTFTPLLFASGRVIWGGGGEIGFVCVRGGCLFGFLFVLFDTSHSVVHLGWEIAVWTTLVLGSASQVLAWHNSPCKSTAHAFIAHDN